jgi:tetratricopeptide (TPR) repeat protein
MLNAGKVKDSLRHFKAAIDGYPDEAEYVAYYGYALFRTSVKGDPGRAEEGIKLMEKATELKPMAPKPYHLIGKAYLQRGDGSKAKRWLRKSLKLQADNPEAVRDYRRASEMEAGAGPVGNEEEPEAKKGLKGLFGRLGGKGKKKSEEVKESFNPEDFLVSQKEE